MGDDIDLTMPGQERTGFGTSAEVDALITSLNANGIDPVADVVYNHRDGGKAEDNPAVKDYIEISELITIHKDHIFGARTMDGRSLQLSGVHHTGQLVIDLRPVPAEVYWLRIGEQVEKVIIGK